MSAFAEFPLLVFTILEQLAVGVAMAIILVQYGLDAESRPHTLKRVRKQNIAALILLAIGALFSLAHLGTPLHAPFTLLHLGSSWLSAEIAAVMLFGCALLLSTWRLFRPLPCRLEKWLEPFTALSGLLLVFAMSKVYSRAFTPSWHSCATFFLFLATALILGALWMGCAISWRCGQEYAESMYKTWTRVLFMAVCGFVLLAICLPWAVPFLDLSVINPASQEALPQSLASLQSWHAAFDGTAIIIFLAAIWRKANRDGATIADAAKVLAPRWYLVWLSFLLALLGELLGRAAFYMSYSRLGM